MDIAGGLPEFVIRQLALVEVDVLFTVQNGEAVLIGTIDKVLRRNGQTERIPRDVLIRAGVDVVGILAVEQVHGDDRGARRIVRGVDVDAEALTCGDVGQLDGPVALVIIDRVGAPVGVGIVAEGGGVAEADVPPLTEEHTAAVGVDGLPAGGADADLRVEQPVGVPLLEQLQRVSRLLRQRAVDDAAVLLIEEAGVCAHRAEHGVKTHEAVGAVVKGGIEAVGVGRPEDGDGGVARELGFLERLGDLLNVAERFGNVQPELVEPVLVDHQNADTLGRDGHAGQAAQLAVIGAGLHEAVIDRRVDLLDAVADVLFIIVGNVAELTVFGGSLPILRGAHPRVGQRVRGDRHGELLVVVGSGGSPVEYDLDVVLVEQPASVEVILHRVVALQRVHGVRADGVADVQLKRLVKLCKILVRVFQLFRRLDAAVGGRCVGRRVGAGVVGSLGGGLTAGGKAQDHDQNQQ